MQFVLGRMLVYNRKTTSELPGIMDDVWWMLDGRGGVLFTGFFKKVVFQRSQIVTSVGIIRLTRSDLVDNHRVVSYGI